MNVFRILPIALALFAAPSLVIPNVSEGPGRAVVRAAVPQATEIEFEEPQIVISERTAPKVRTSQAIPTTPLRGAVTPRAPV